MEEGRHRQRRIGKASKEGKGLPRAAEPMMMMMMMMMMLMMMMKGRLEKVTVLGVYNSVFSKTNITTRSSQTDFAQHVPE